ncbi:unnamed protein product [Urochloa humidicola]
MAEEQEWKALARQQAVEAPDHCERAGNLLAGARPALAPQALMANPQACRTWARGAEGMVADASGELAAAARDARAARLLVLALHDDGAARAPGEAAPPLSADNVPSELVRTALAHLEDAGVRAGRACGHATVCRGNLLGAVRLLDRPRPLPDGHVVDGLANAMLESALDNLDSAKKLAQETVQLVYDALLLLLA